MERLYREDVLFQLEGKRNRRYWLKPGCGNKMCIHPEHAVKYKVKPDLKPFKYQHPEVDDRMALLQWYAAGNSPVRAIDVEHAKAILQAAGTDLRPDARSKRLPRRT